MTDTKKKLIEKKLDDLALAKARLHLVRAEQETKIEQIIPQELMDQIQDIKDELSPALKMAEQKIKEIEEDIKNDIIFLGETVKGSAIMGVFNQGRDSVNVSGLMGYAKEHPEVKSFIKKGSPYVSFKDVKGK